MYAYLAHISGDTVPKVPRNRIKRYLLLSTFIGKAIDLSSLVKSMKESGGCEQASWAEITRIIQAIFLATHPVLLSLISFLFFLTKAAVNVLRCSPSFSRMGAPVYFLNKLLWMLFKIYLEVVKREFGSKVKLRYRYLLSIFPTKRKTD